MDYEVEGVKPRSRRKKIWSEIIEKDCETQQTCSKEPYEMEKVN